MIKFYNQVPSVYTSASRDFQYLCWLIDIVLNSVKHNIDDLYDLPNSDIDPKLAELLAITLGFKVKRNYDQKQLKALVAVLPRILRYKGTNTAITMAGNALVAASGTTGNFYIDESTVNKGELKVVFPENLVDISLFSDLLPYILPAGMTCHIVRTNRVYRTYTTELDYHDIVMADWIPAVKWDRTAQTSLGLAELFDTGLDVSSSNQDYALSNYLPLKDRDDNRTMLERFNAGLLDNSIIPTLEKPLVDPEYKTNTVENVGELNEK